MSPAAQDRVAVIADRGRAASLMKPLRQRILAAARAPASATSIAASLGLSRQAVNYHVRQLARAGLLRRAGRQRKRGLVEQNYVVSAQAYVLAPEVLGPLCQVALPEADKLSAAYVMAMANLVQREVGRAWRDAEAQGKRLPLLALDSVLTFESAAARAAFASAVTDALTRAIAEHAVPPGENRSTSARRYRLSLSCYPIPPVDAAPR
jgi:predicted ArsR family transcriptional regulator